jgi:hypothetical protein
MPDDRRRTLRGLCAFATLLVRHGEVNAVAATLSTAGGSGLSPYCFLDVIVCSENFFEDRDNPGFPREMITTINPVNKVGLPTTYEIVDPPSVEDIDNKEKLLEHFRNNW